MSSSRESGIKSVSLRELENIMDNCKLDLTQIDEVWPNLYIGDLTIAQNRGMLQKMGITHVLNAAHSKQGSIGDQMFYGKNITYKGIAAEDSLDFDLSEHFKEAAHFVNKALKKKDGKVLVHCIMGVSRSATLVLAYLMLYQHLSLCDAVQKVIQRRPICPNKNFLKQLLDLDNHLQGKRKICRLL
ncbi:dual specificity protein phosphatase family protein [Erpetoichthys calabaricus]|uniref:Dual specificity protein phosphatase n=1 Tax=Erpetoichthys calabaricus TaxID=27687 RepID=A0A8C4TFY5_ERPCA|nr:dual specificity protein phosphatase family protein [Erpetoichthys calabaricus]XP_028651405.1 dual specificity protein phosphatase family protein [Erpetoichthys calabaricus]